MATTGRPRMLDALEQGNGTLLVAPTWVPRSFCVPGRRIKLHPDDYYALGAEHGGIDERWLASTIRADNGPLTGPDEGMSVVVDDSGQPLATLAETVDELAAGLLGAEFWANHGGWPMYAKFFDNQDPLPIHVHHRREHAALVGQQPKPEPYYFPPQLNNHSGALPVSYLGLRTDVAKDDLRERLARFRDGDNRITELSVAYRMRPGHPRRSPARSRKPVHIRAQQACDVLVMCESVSNGPAVPEDLLWKDVPYERRGDIDFIVDLIDWDANVDADFAHNRGMEPIATTTDEEASEAGHQETWVAYKADAFSAKELTIFPARAVRVRDAAAYGLIAVQGHGTLNNRPIESPTLVRYGQTTFDEFFVSDSAARDGVTITNASEPLVMLQHFGPANPDVPSGTPLSPVGSANGRPQRAEHMTDREGADPALDASQLTTSRGVRPGPRLARYPARQVDRQVSAQADRSSVGGGLCPSHWERHWQVLNAFVGAHLASRA